MNKKITVVITTRNRANDLRQCLGSLAGQTVAPDELIIIDNNSSDQTARVVSNFAKAVRFKVRHVWQKKVGYPHVYNRGLVEAKGNFVAFIDDDCIAHPRWFERIKFITQHFPQLSAILGIAREYYDQDIMSLTKAYLDETGRIGAVQKRWIKDLEILDSKNIVYNKKFLQKHQLKFDANLLKYAQGASEDCDLGMQIGYARGMAIFDEKMRVVHKDPPGFWSYYQKALFTLRNHLVYEQKWHKVRSGIEIERPFIAKFDLFVDFCQRYHLSAWKKLALFSQIALSFFFIKIMRKLLMPQIASLRVKQK